MQKEHAYLKILNRIYLFIPYIIIAWFAILLIRFSEFGIFCYYKPVDFTINIVPLIVSYIIDIKIYTVFSIVYFVVFYWLLSYQRRIFTVVFLIFLSFYSLIYLILTFYTTQAELLPDSLILTYNRNNSKYLLDTYSYLWIPLLIIFFIIQILTVYFYKNIKRIRFSKKASIILLILTFGLILFPYTFIKNLSIILLILTFGLILFPYTFIKNLSTNSENLFTENKVYYFFKDLICTKDIEHYTVNNENIAKELISNHKGLNNDFPLYRERDTLQDVLSPYFHEFEQPPNLVFIIVESLGRNYSGQDAIYGSYTPFLDSLAKNSLYWYNFLSTSGRTFQALPSIFSSVPYGKAGFCEYGEQFPYHTSLLRNLKHNGYFISFFYGGWMRFDNMDLFLQYHLIDYAIKYFPKQFKKMGNEKNSWGYDDKTLFSYSFKVLDSFPQNPRVDIYLTLSNHKPWNFSEMPVYEKRAEQFARTFDEQVNEEDKTYLKKCMAATLYADDALRKFFNDYKKRPEYENTIFIITGDHGISYSNELYLKKFHVPLIIYSPKLKKTAVFKGLCSHLDIAPSLEKLLQHKAKLHFPLWTCYSGDCLDTSKYFKNKKIHTFIWESRTYPDIIYSNYYLNNDDLYVIADNFKQTLVKNEAIEQELKIKKTALVNLFKFLPESNKILPYEVFIQTYAKKLIPTGDSSIVKNLDTFEVEGKVFSEEFIPLYNLELEENNYQILYIEAEITAKLLQNHSKRFELVIETLDFEKDKISWINHPIDFELEKSTKIDLKKYFILKMTNDYRKITYIKLYFWNPEKGNVKIDNINFKVYIE